jgi:hypothetical protein
MQHQGSHPGTIRGARGVAILLAGILAGSVLIQPAVAHVTARLKHLTKHLDGVYVNESQVGSDLDPRYVNEGQVTSDLDPRYVNEDQITEGHASCQGLSFLPSDNDTGYSNSATLRTRAGTGGSGIFRCAVQFPHGATIDRAEFIRVDNSGTEQVGGCMLKAGGLLEADTSEYTLGDVPATGGTEVIGTERASDTTITDAVVDNEARGYWFECSLSGASGVGIYGASARYTLPGAHA